LKKRDTYARVDGDVLFLGNGLLEIRLSAITGGIMGIENKKTSIQYVNQEESSPVFYLWTLLSDKLHPHGPYFGNDSEPVKIRSPNRKTFQSFKLDNTAQSESIVIEHRLLGSIDVAYTLTVSKDSDLTYWRIKVKNQEKDVRWGQVVGIGFPQLGGLRLGQRSENDVLVRPNRFGEKIPDPVGKAGSYPVNLCYEGFASMMWMDLYNTESSSGLYLASYDKTLLMTELESEADVETRTMRLGLRKYAYIPPGGSWVSEPYVIGVHSGDWHWGADAYRYWAKSWMQKPDVPDWVREVDGWYGVGLGPRQYHDSDSVYRFGHIPSLYREAEYVGLNWIEVWGQMVMNGCYRFYYPDPYLGTVSELKDAIRKVRKRGGHIGFYVNVQAFDPRLPQLPVRYHGRIPPDVPIPSWWDEFRNYAAVHFDGSHTRQYIRHDEWSDGHRIMCTACEGWRRYLMYWAIDKYVKDYGADVMYIDQVSSPPVEYCFDFTHGHSHHGACVQGRTETLKRMVEEGRKAEQDFALVFEGNGDAVGQYGHVHLLTSVAGQTQYPYPEVFSYTFPDAIIIDGFANGWSQETMSCYYPKMKNRTWRNEDVVNRVFLFGYRFDLCLPLKSGDPFTEYVRKVINLRKRIKTWLYSSRFMDEIGLQGLPENVVAKIFSHDECLIVTILDNRALRAPFELRIELEQYESPRIEGVTMHTLEDTGELEYVVDQNAVLVKISVLPEEIAALILHKAMTKDPGDKPS